jgi:peptide/nickel transport system substrate-binding protein
MRASMRTFARNSLAIASLAALVVTAAACSSSGGSGTKTNKGGGGNILSNGVQGLNEAGTPKAGGNLNMLGSGDVDYMDYNLSYYTIGYLAQRMWVRGLYAYPAIPGKTTTVAADLATGAPVVSNGGLTYTVTIRTGAQWDTTPARQVTGADAVLGLKRSCNPVQPFGGLPDYENLIKGFAQFCAGFTKAKPTVAGIKDYITKNQISGVTASGNTVTYNLTQPASYFADELTLPPFNPAPIESLKYLPASADSAQHMIADGPYKISSYVPAKSLDFVRNPAWQASTDPIRKAYVDTIHISETGDPVANQQVLETGTAAGGIEFDSFPPVDELPKLIDQMKAGQTKNFNMGPSFSSNPYIVFNEESPNNNGALQKTAVRQALSYAINRTHLIQVDGGPLVSPPLTHVLPNGLNGSQYLPANYDPYPYNPTKAKQLLASAGYKNGLTLIFLYRTESTVAPKMYQTLKADLAKVGVTVKGLAVPSADFYTKYMEVPSTAKRGVWDFSLAGWGPDWYGDAAASFFEPLFDGTPTFPPYGSNFEYYNNPTVNAQIAKAAALGDAVQAGKLWAQIDQAVMKDAPFYPITQGLQANYHSAFVHNAVYVPAVQGFDPTNVWLGAPGA